MRQRKIELRLRDRINVAFETPVCLSEDYAIGYMSMPRESV